MPFRAFGSSPDYYRFDTSYEPSGAGLTLEDLLGPSLRMEYPEAPQPITRTNQLDQERKRQLRNQAILMAAQAIGQGSTSGQIGSALAGAAQGFQGFRGDTLAAAQDEQQQAYLAQRQQAEREFTERRAEVEEQQRRRRAEATLAAVQEISQDDPDLGARVAQAARLGDDKTVQALLAEAPKRKAMRSYGLSADDPFADDTMKSIIEQNQRLATERSLRDEGLDRYFQEPGKSPEEEARRAGMIAEAQAGAYARYRQTGDDKELRRILEVGDVPGLVTIGPDGVPQFRAAEGLPEPRSRYIRVEDDPYTDENEGGWYDPYHPEKGPQRFDAKPKPTAPTGKPAPSAGGTRPAPPKPAAAPKASPAEAQAREKIAAAVNTRMPNATPAQRAAAVKKALDLWRRRQKK
jgi:hypothetical protein